MSSSPLVYLKQRKKYSVIISKQKSDTENREQWEEKRLQQEVSDESTQKDALYSLFLENRKV